MTVTPPSNDKYGPKDLIIEALVDGQWQQLAVAEQPRNGGTYQVTPTQAQGIRLVITSAYDIPGITPRNINVQVAEVTTS